MHETVGIDQVPTVQKDHLKDCGDNDLSFNVDGASVLDEFVKSDVKDGLTVRMHALLLRIMVGATFRKLVAVLFSSPPFIITWS